MRLIDADALLEAIKTDVMGGLNYRRFIEEAPTIEPKTRVIAQVAFDENKMREIVHEAVERIKKEQTMSELHKYKCTLFGTIFFVLLTEKERKVFESKYRIPLELCD